MENSQIDLLTIGDVSIDLYMKVEDTGVEDKENGDKPLLCFYHGSKIPVRSLHSNVAGNAVNVGVGATKLGISTAIYSEMGDDSDADRVIKELTYLGINTAFLHKNEGQQTGIHPVIVHGGERTIFSHHERREYSIQNWPTPKWIYYTSVSEGFEEFQKSLVDYLKENFQIGVAFNPGTYQMKSGLDSLRDILKVTDVLFVNKEEAIAWVGAGNTEQLHMKLQELGPKLTVITDGANGATAHDRATMLTREAFEPNKQIVDRTGAGDAFASGFLSALIYNQPLDVALKWGAINSSSVIREVGAINGLQTKDEISKKSNEIN